MPIGGSGPNKQLVWGADDRQPNGIVVTKVALAIFVKLSSLKHYQKTAPKKLIKILPRTVLFA